MEFRIKSSCLDEVKVFSDNSSLPILVDLQHLHETANEFYVSNELNGRVFVYELSGQISHLFRARSSLTFRQEKSLDSL